MEEDGLGKLRRAEALRGEMKNGETVHAPEKQLPSVICIATAAVDVQIGQYRTVRH